MRHDKLSASEAEGGLVTLSFFGKNSDLCDVFSVNLRKP
jgi:hypothetical protein